MNQEAQPRILLPRASSLLRHSSVAQLHSQPEAWNCDHEGKGEETESHSTSPSQGQCSSRSMAGFSAPQFPLLREGVT